jgi:hypothetical protein
MSDIAQYSEIMWVSKRISKKTEMTNYMPVVSPNEEKRR